VIYFTIVKTPAILSEKEIAETFAALRLETEEQRKTLRFEPAAVQTGSGIRISTVISQPIFQPTTDEDHA
jgi:hypothetical protein